MIEAATPTLRPKRRVVIIDDEPAFAETLRWMVESLGYDSTISTDARSSFVGFTPDDIVFLDILMPNLSGFRVLDQLLSKQAKNAIVLMSGSLDRLEEAEKHAEALRLNLVGALEKPFRLADISDVLAETE